VAGLNLAEPASKRKVSVYMTTSMTHTDATRADSDHLEPLLPPKRNSGFGAFARPLVVPIILSTALTAVLFAVTQQSGKIGMFFVWSAALMVLFYINVRVRTGARAASDAVVTLLLGGAAALVIAALALILGFVVMKAARYFRFGFFTNTLEGIDPDAPATTGGASHAILGTIAQVLIATLISLPFGVLTAIYLNEVGGKFAGFIRLIIDAMSGIPSVVAGLFIYSLWVVKAGRGYSGLAAGLALSVLMLPTIARTTEEMLRLVPGGLRESALALGAPEWRTALRVVLPTAKPGIITAVILGIARVAGETAPLLMTAFGNDRSNFSKTFVEAQSALPLFIFQQVTSAQGAAVDRAWVGALVLIGIVLTLFVIARLAGRQKLAGQQK
jgi:phosphate transport system permease protein